MRMRVIRCKCSFLRKAVSVLWRGLRKIKLLTILRYMMDWQEHAARIYKEAGDALSLVQTSLFKIYRCHFVGRGNVIMGEKTGKTEK